MATEDITWKKPKSIAITIAWGIINASIVLQAFLGGRQFLAWYDVLFLFLVGVFAGGLLAEVKAVVVGIFEALFISVALVYFCIVLPVIVGNVVGYYHANAIYSMTAGWVFWEFFPLGVMPCFLGGLLGGLAEGLIF